jgi:MerR family transcriptional regulator, light-induced transcriptional regulator
MSDRRSSRIEPAPVSTGAHWRRSDSRRSEPLRNKALASREQLIGTIEAEIVPRLLMMLSASHRAAAVQQPARQIPEFADVTELARLLLAHDAPVALAFAQTVRDRGAPFDCLCRELFAPAARQLSELWESEQCDFRTFEFALSRLYAVLQELGAGER